MGDKIACSRGNMEELDICPVCNKEIESSKLISNRTDDNNLMPDKWKNYLCISCSSIFINPRPKKETLPNLYSDYLTHKNPLQENVELSDSLSWCLVRGYLKYRFNISWEKKALKLGFIIFSRIPFIRKKLDRYGRNLKKLNLNENAKLLDLGCGAGEFLKLAKRMGYTVSGCDFDPVVVNMCNIQNLNVRQGGIETFSKYQDYFDIITLNQVLEHVIAPENLIVDCYDHLNKDGYIWIALPNPNSFGFKIFGSAWAGLHAPYHLSLPSQKILVEWLQKAGFTDIKLLKRGMHAKNNWRESQEIAKNHNIKLINNFWIKIYLYLANFLSIFSSKWGEETVIIAKKSF